MTGDFLTFTAAQTFCLVAMGATLQGAVTYLTINMMQSMDEHASMEHLKASMHDVVFTYHVLEMMADIVFGTPLVIMVLYRQCFPIKVEVQKAVQSEDWHKMKSREVVEASSMDGDRGPNNLRDQAVEQLQQQIDDKEGHWRPIASESGSKLSRRMDEEQAISTAFADRQNCNRELVRDACGYTGPGAGRSIVLDALQQVNHYPRRRRKTSPWGTVAAGPLSIQVNAEYRGQQTGGIQQYATPHGIVEGVPLTPIGRPEETHSPKAT